MHSYRYKPTQSNKYIDGCQVLKETLEDINSSDQNGTMQNGWIEKEEVEYPVPPCGRGV